MHRDSNGRERPASTFLGLLPKDGTIGRAEAMDARGTVVPAAPCRAIEPE
jgi:hypothetical protein